MIPSQRGASNVYFSVSRSAISIPPWVNPLYNLIDEHLQLIESYKEDFGEMGVAKVYNKYFSAYTREEFDDALEKRLKDIKEFAEICVCMMLSLLPTAALAVESPTMTIGGTSVTVPMTVGNYTYGTNDSGVAQTLSEQTTLPDSGWSWALRCTAAGEYTLTLNGFAVTITSGTGIAYENMNLNLFLTGENTIKAVNCKAIKSESGALTISGTGSLNATGMNGYGIDAKGLTISGGNLRVAMSTSGVCALHSAGDLTISGGTVVLAAWGSSSGCLKSETDSIAVTGDAWCSDTQDGGEFQSYTSGDGGQVFVYNAKMLVLANDEFVGYDDFATGWNAAVAATSAIVTLFDDWTATDGSFGTGDGFGSGAIYIPKNKTITLDLNGHNIDRALTAASTSGHVIWVSNGGSYI